jgi:hypothetical protein
VVSDAAYGAGWDGDTTVAPSKNAVYDKIETLGGAAGTVGGPALIVVKASNESVTSSTTLQDDDELLFAIGASETWIAELTLYVTGNAAGDILVDITAPSGATGVWGGTGLIRTATTDESGNRERALPSFGSGGVSFGVVTANVQTVRLYATIINSTNAGNVTLQWAQLASNGTATVVNAGSCLRAHRVA